MDVNQFSQINTSISVKEKDLITPQHFDKLLAAHDKKSMAILLQSTPYQLSEDDLDDLDKIEQSLMAELIKTYQWAYEETPNKGIVQLLSLRYTYHNLKVLLKAKACQKDMSRLLLPIGEPDLPVLDHLVTTLSSDAFPETIITELQGIWSDYQDYQDLRVLEIGADLAYFKHLTLIAEALGDMCFQKAVTIIIDLYNMITVRRSRDQHKPISFMKQLLSDEASLSSQDYISLTSGEDMIAWYHQLNGNDFSLALKSYEDKIRQGTITAVDLEHLADDLLFHLFDEAKYTSDSPYSLARFLLGKEMEVTNLRLLLSAMVNQLPMTLVTERMRPIYGQ